jgi:hypothetical protein
MEVYRTPGSGLRIVRRSAAALAMAICALLISFGVGHELARWRSPRIDTLDDAYGIGEEHSAEVRRKALVAMLREGRSIIRHTREAAASSDPEVAANAKASLATLRDDLDK